MSTDEPEARRDMKYAMYAASQAMLDVVDERFRQRYEEGWTPDHDEGHADGELAQAAAWYALPIPIRTALDTNDIDLWPFDWEWFKPTDRRRDLVKAGALIIAEIERLDRLEKAGTDPENSPISGPGYEIDEAGCVRFLIDDAGGGQ